METLTVQPDFKSLRVVRSYVQSVAEAAGLDKQATYRLTLAVEELTSNIIEHGYSRLLSDNPITLAATRYDRHLAVEVEDAGQPFDVSAAALPDVNLPLVERKRGGLGNLLILKNVDEFRYERIGDRNRNTLIVSVPGR